MKLINVKIDNIKVGSFTPSNRNVLLEIEYNTDKLRAIRLENTMDNPKEVALFVIKGIRKKERWENYELGGEKILDSYVNVIIEEEDAILEKIESFLTKVHEKVNEITTLKTSDSYLSKLNGIRMMKIRL